MIASNTKVAYDSYRIVGYHTDIMSHIIGCTYVILTKYNLNKKKEEKE